MVKLELAKCLHAQHRNVTCARCVEACPRDALLLGPSGPLVAAARCDDCGRCVPACTECALEGDVPGPELRRDHRGQWVAFAACTKSGAVAATLPCHHSLDWPALVGAHGRGARHWLVASAPCAGCERDAAARDSLETRLAALATLSERRGEGAVVVEFLPASIWAARRGACMPEPSRRALFRRLAPAVPSPTRTRETVHRFAIAIDATHCSGCLACAGVCPHRAIAVDDAPRALTFDAAACTGCELCVAACDDGALVVRELAMQLPTRLPLTPVTCPTCREVHHRPAASQVPCARRPPPPRVLVLEDP